MEFLIKTPHLNEERLSGALVIWSENREGRFRASFTYPLAELSDLNTHNICHAFRWYRIERGET